MIYYIFRSSEDPRIRTNHTKESYNIRKSVSSGECNHQKYIPEFSFSRKILLEYIYT